MPLTVTWDASGAASFVEATLFPGAERGWEWVQFGPDALNFGVIRGWGLNPKGYAQPARDVPGSTYPYFASGDPPSVDEWRELQRARDRIWAEKIKPVLEWARAGVAADGQQSLTHYYGWFRAPFMGGESAFFNAIRYELTDVEFGLWSGWRRELHSAGELDVQVLKAVAQVSDVLRYVPVPVLGLAAQGAALVAGQALAAGAQAAAAAGQAAASVVPVVSFAGSVASGALDAQAQLFGRLGSDATAQAVHGSALATLAAPGASDVVLGGVTAAAAPNSTVALAGARRVAAGAVALGTTAAGVAAAPLASSAAGATGAPVGAVRGALSLVRQGLRWLLDQGLALVFGEQ